MAFDGIGQIAINVRDTLDLPLLFAMPKMAFFRDTEGTTLALMSEVRA